MNSFPIGINFFQTKPLILAAFCSTANDTVLPATNAVPAFDTRLMSRKCARERKKGEKLETQLHNCVKYLSKYLMSAIHEAAINRTDFSNS